ncbi:MAG: alpha/beta fold hydrolase [Cytophagales bacterium]|nr:alpha/beta fold hydrolase [Cytophagales bacterium]
MKTLFVALTLLGSQLNAQCILKTAALKNFRTVSGQEIWNCFISYRTLGKLNTAKSNVILWPTWFTGKSDVICNGVATMTMDTTGFYIVIVDAFGNGVSSSPSNSSSFPEITIRDMVNAQHILLTKHLNIDHIKAVMGISMGGMQTLEWLVTYPGFADKAISIAGTPKQSVYDLLFWKTQAALLTSAAKDEPSQKLALRMVSNVQLLGIHTPAYWLNSSKPQIVDSLMLAQQSSMLQSMKPDDLLCQLNAMIGHDIYKSLGTPISAINELIKAKTLMIVFKTDHVVNPGPSVELSKLIGATLAQLDNECGHLSFLCDASMVKDEVVRFLQK